eukprot:23705-Rhodomonas_salina.1
MSDSGSDSRRRAAEPRARLSHSGSVSLSHSVHSSWWEPEAGEASMRIRLPGCGEETRLELGWEIAQAQAVLNSYNMQYSHSRNLRGRIPQLGDMSSGLCSSLSQASESPQEGIQTK